MKLLFCIIEAILLIYLLAAICTLLEFTGVEHNKVTIFFWVCNTLIAARAGLKSQMK